MFNIVGGFIAIALGILAFIAWPWRVLEVFQGILPIVLIAGGIVAVVAGWELINKRIARASEDDETVKPKKKPDPRLRDDDE